MQHINFRVCVCVCVSAMKSNSTNRNVMLEKNSLIHMLIIFLKECNLIYFQIRVTKSNREIPKKK